MTLQEIGIDFEARTKEALLSRAHAAVEHLLGEIQEAYYQKVIGSRGGAGSIGSLTTAITQADGTLTAIIGAGASAQYFRYLEYGVRPASSDPSAGPAYSRMPPAIRMAEWTRRARLAVPAQFYGKPSASGRKRGKQAPDEAKARLRWGFAIAMKRKKYGYKGLHIIIRVAEREAANIRRILEQGTAA